MTIDAPHPKFKPFQKDGSILVILTDPIEIPFYEDGIASNFSLVPLEITNPNEWTRTFTGYICWNLCEQKHEIHSHSNIQEINFFDERVTEGYIPFDHATGRLRGILGLLKLAYHYYGKEKEMPEFPKKL